MSKPESQPILREEGPPPARRFSATFSRMWAVLATLAIIPVVMGLGLVLPLALWPGLPDWVPPLFAIPVVAVSLLGVRYCYTAWAAVPAEVLLTEEGILIRLQRASPLYKRAFTAGWSGISSVTAKVDPRHGRRIYRLTFRGSETTVQLMPDEYSDAGMETSLGEALQSFIMWHNERHVGSLEISIWTSGFTVLLMS